LEAGGADVDVVVDEGDRNIALGVDVDDKNHSAMAFVGLRIHHISCEHFASNEHITFSRGTVRMID